MSDSETSSEARITYHNKNDIRLSDEKDNRKPVSTDTDYYLRDIANPSKIVQLNRRDEETSEISGIMDRTSSESSSSSSRRSSKSSKSSSSSKTKSTRSRSSKAKYDRISVSPPKQNNFIPMVSGIAAGYNGSGVATNFPQQQQQNQMSTANVVQPETKELTPQEIRMKKIELLRRLCELKAKGYTLTKEYDKESTLDEMEYEYDLLKSFVDKRNGVKIYKNFLLNGVSVIEFLNDKYDPFEFELNGWSEHMSVEVDTWDDVWEDIYEKYKGTGSKMAPEIKLLYLMVASAAAFHFSKVHSAQLPGLDKMLQSNPGLINKLMGGNNKEQSQFMTAQELNIQKQKEEMKKKEMDMKMKQNNAQQQQQQIDQLRDQIRKQQEEIERNKSNFGPLASNATIPSGTLPKPVTASELKFQPPTIRPPHEVRDLLNRIHNLKPAKPSYSETQDETTSNNDRLLSETTISESNPNKKRLGKKKPSIQISL